jgi:hypothetical protein
MKDPYVYVRVKLIGLAVILGSTVVAGVVAVVRVIG